MKKNQQKAKPQPKTKIQLKIKSKNVTNNFILTPRTASIIDQRDNIHKIDKFAEEIKSQKQRKDEMTIQKANKDSKKPQYRMVSTDHPKITTARKKYEEDETGTHTPLLKRVSFTSDIGNKKKSTQSLINTEKVKGKRKANSKLSNSSSSEINKFTLQRLIGVIIKDYKQGKLKQKQLQQTLMQLYDRKEKKKSLGKIKRRKDLGYSSFSNQFIKSSHQIKSEALVRKLKKSDQIHQTVLERKGFVNKIIIKGITTSLFLKEDAELTSAKESETKTKYREPSYQINTSNSIKEIYDDMVNIKQNIFQDNQNVQQLNFKEKMAIKIQRAWRRYQTRKILKEISKRKKLKREQHPFHILDQFTDEQNDEQYNESTFTRNIVRPNDFEAQSNQYSELVNIISSSLQEKKLSKEECLKKILQFLHYPEQLLDTAQKQKNQNNNIKSDEEQANQQVLIQPLLRQQSGQESRVIIFNSFPQVNQMQQQVDQQASQGDQSNELNSFTNKYSSKQVNNDNRQYFVPQQENTSQLDDSLTYVHSQTGGNESFKMINIQNIEEGLKGREESLQLKKQKELEDLTERLFMKKISKDQYSKQKEKIQKWFKSRQKQLKKVKNSLLKSCMDAKSILQNDSKILTSEKSKKMLKCLSDKYIKKQDWLIKDQKMKENLANAGEHLPCEQNQFEQLDVGRAIEQNKHQAELDNEDEQIIFNNNDALQVEWEPSKGYEISPKLSRHTSLDQNQYKYEEIEKIIEEDDDDTVEAGLGKIQNRLLSSDKLINVSQKNDNYISAEEISLINNYVNETTKKFKYLCTQDKQDIFQFLFLDMVLEMFTESYPGQTKILRTAQIYINKAKRLRKIPKGIKTNLASCKEYLRILYDFVIRQQNSLKGLLAPMGPSATEMLRYMRDQITETQDEDNLSAALVLPVDIFEKLGKTKELELKLERYYEDQQKQYARVSFLKTALHINNKALFDSLNEMLDHERPYGVWGKPFPWKKALSIDKKWTKPEQQRKLRVSIDKTIECCSYLCGILVDKQDSLFGNHRVSQQYITQIRQDRLSKMLANDLIQNEQRWIFYDDELAEILMQASAYVTKKLIKELVLQLVGLRMSY